MASSSLLRLMHLVSPALPIGAYAYSQGQEYAVDAQWLNSDKELAVWMRDILQGSFAHVDLPILARLQQAWACDDLPSVKHWNHRLRAFRETRELLLEDEQLGLALKRLLISLGVERAEIDLEAPPSFATLFALAGQHWQIETRELLQGFAWSWLENQVAAATKTVPLGQTQGQKILDALLDDIPAHCDYALALNDDELGFGMPGLAVASSRHERQYSRLFRS